MESRHKRRDRGLGAYWKLLGGGVLEGAWRVEDPRDESSGTVMHVRPLHLISYRILGYSRRMMPITSATA